MKKLLSLLLCYVFLQTQTFAMRGGPAGNGNTTLSGTYSILLIQTSPLYNINNNQVSTEAGDGLGLVLLSVPASGPATGSLLIFDSQTSDSFLGKSNGLSDPRTGTLTSLVSGTQYRISTTSSTSAGTGTGVTTSTETISGKMLVKKKTITSTSTLQQVTGSATLTTAGIPTLGNGQTTTYEVVGYQTASTTGLSSGFVLTDSTL